ncbi:MAG: hypothetical protein D6728_08970 [Cyanobacteria bacterium J055]|nr:MAG: hypothetical protein D6728_08970 [Cyanobacteria bacterium J055]
MLLQFFVKPHSNSLTPNDSGTMPQLLQVAASFTDLKLGGTRSTYKIYRLVLILKLTLKLFKKLTIKLTR